MKILALTAENIKKLTVVQITPEGNLIQITGKNGQGKTSVLDSIWYALTGSTHIPSQPIRQGADKARIELKLGSGGVTSLIVERRFTEKSSTLTVKTAEGFSAPKPQELLNDMVGALALDPLDFMHRDGKGQFDALKGLVKLDIDLEQSAKDDAIDYAKRTEVNRDAKAKRTQAAAITVAPNLPEAAIDESKLLGTLQAGADANQDIERRKGNRALAQQAAANFTAEAARVRAMVEPDTRAVILQRDADLDMLQAQIDALNKRKADTLLNTEALVKAIITRCDEAATKADAEADALNAKLTAAGDLPEPVDLTALRSEVDKAKIINAAIAARDQRAAFEKAAEAAETEADALTDRMAKRAQAKLDALAKAEMPVPGLGFGDGTVTFKGLPLDQASDAEQLMISAAIAAALSPKLRVIRIRDGSLLDADAMTALGKFADERDMQIWVERVDGSGSVGIVMEDGHVKDAEPPKADAQADDPKATAKGKHKAKDGES